MGDVHTKRDQQRRSSKGGVTRGLETVVGALNIAACANKKGTHESSSDQDLGNGNIVNQTI